MIWNRTFFFLLFILCIKLCLMWLLMASGYLSLAPDEAQYWTWSQALDFGYYSKPPFIAWQIALTTSLFGNTEFGVRAGAALIGCILSLVIYWSALFAKCNQKSAFWAALGFAVAPLGVFLSFASTTDGGAILFFALSAMLFAKELQKNARVNYVSIGFSVLLGALYKWTAYIIWPFLFIFALFIPRARTRSLIWGVALSLLALLPALYWNTTHDFATFRHVYTTVASGGNKGGNVVDFIGAQISLFSPIFFCLAILGALYIFKNGRKMQKALLFYAVIFSALVIYVVLAIFKKMQPNWAAYLYPPVFVVIGFYARSILKRGRFWLIFGTCISLILTAGALAIPYIQDRGLHRGLFPLSYRLNPFRQNMGWKNLSPILTSCGYHPDTDFLFADKYQMASLLSFYGPKQKRAYFFNLGAQRKNQFSYWPQMSSLERDRTGYFVIAENREKNALHGYEAHYLAALAPYFKTITYCGAYPLFSAHKTAVKYALIFKAEGYNGQTPPETFKY